MHVNERHSQCWTYVACSVMEVTGKVCSVMLLMPLRKRVWMDESYFIRKTVLFFQSDFVEELTDDL